MMIKSRSTQILYVEYVIIVMPMKRICFQKIRKCLDEIILTNNKRNTK